MTEYVKVPKHLLERLEQDRVKLYDLLDDIHDNSTFSAFFKQQTLGVMMECTSVMWKVANRKWEKCDD
tara:strand:- start:12574 stop:12777 length:204 start_codon:yes stop_codon:yes gene_type:complete